MNTSNLDVAVVLEYPGEEVEFSGSAELEPVDLGDERIHFDEPFAFTVKLTRVGDGIVVRGTATGRAGLRCGRCLDEFSYELAVDIDEVASLPITDTDADIEEGFKVEGGRLNLTPIVYQNAVVSIPMQPLCRERCSGLCQTCGKNLNAEPHVHDEAQVDERLAPLKEFFKNRDD